MKPAAGAGRGGRAVTRNLKVRTTARTELREITGEVEQAIAASGVGNGVCYLVAPHTTAGVIVNENDDPAVARDIETVLDRMVPAGAGYRHLEGNADAHVKSALVGVSALVLIEGGRPALGRWQGIFFCEFDGPRERQVRLKIVADPGE